MNDPRLLADLDWVLAQAEPGAAGAVWRLQERDRQLDAELVRLTAGERVELHDELGVDMLLLPLSGGGTLSGDAGHAPLVPHALMWLPRGSRRSLAAGPDGLAYVTVCLCRKRTGSEIRLPGDPEQSPRREGRAHFEHNGGATFRLPRLCPRCGAPGEAAVNRMCSNCGAVPAT